MKAIKVLFLCLFIGSLGACSKKDDLSGIDDISGLGGDTWAQTSLDQWLYDTLTVPYNIEVKYKWSQFEFDVTKTLVPPDESKIIPVITDIKKVWIDTYVAEAGEEFFKTYCPKTFVLSGSASWNDNGTITLGTAEGGRKVVLYLLNDFRTKGMEGYEPSDSSTVKQIFHVIEHEFGHILHQSVIYPASFKQITAGLYNGNWNLVSDADAQRDGFVTAYASSGYDDDFVETISIMLTEGRAGFDSIVNSIPSGVSDNGVTQAKAQASLREKEATVVSYFKDTWKVDFYSLQSRTRGAIEKLLY